MNDLQQDIEDFKSWLDETFGEIEVCGGFYKASEVFETLNQKDFEKALNVYIKEKDEKRSI